MELTLGLILFLLLLSVRYAEKKWIPREAKSKTSGVVVERILPSKAGSGTVSVGNTKRTENLVEERKIPQLFNNSGNISAPQNGRTSVLPKLAKQVKMITLKKKKENSSLLGCQSMHICSSRNSVPIILLHTVIMLMFFPTMLTDYVD